MPAEDPPCAGRHPAPTRRLTRRTLVAAALVAAGVASALVAATTTPFTGPANLVTALPIVALAVLVIACWPLRPEPRPPPSASADSHPWRAWTVLSGAIVLWEVAEYAARGSRAIHPTLSSMLNAVDRHEGLKALVFFLWLCLGAAIAWQGRRTPHRAATQADGTGPPPP